MKNLEGETLKLREDLTLVSVDDQAALLDVQKKCYYDPNDTALSVLKLMENGCRYEDIKTQLVLEFAVAEERARRDIDIFIEELHGLGLIEAKEEAMAPGILRELREERRAYRAPQLEHPAEIAVVGGGIGPSPDTSPLG